MLPVILVSLVSGRFCPCHCKLYVFHSLLFICVVVFSTPGPLVINVNFWCSSPDDVELKRKTRSPSSPETSIPALVHRQATHSRHLQSTNTETLVAPDIVTNKKLKNNKENVTVDLTTTPSASTVKVKAGESSQQKLKPRQGQPEEEKNLRGISTAVMKRTSRLHTPPFFQAPPSKMKKIIRKIRPSAVKQESQALIRDDDDDIFCFYRSVKLNQRKNTMTVVTAEVFNKV